MPIKVLKTSNTIADDMADQLLAMNDEDLFEISEFARLMPEDSYYDLASAIEVDDMMAAA